MTRVRYLLIWVIVVFVIMFFVSWGIEGTILEMEAHQVQSMTELAADTSLQAGQGIDDFFTQLDVTLGDMAIQNINDEARDKFNLNIVYHKYSSDMQFRRDDLFTWYFDRASSLMSAEDKRAYAFSQLYDATGKGTVEGRTYDVSDEALEFQKFVKRGVGAMPLTQIPYTYTESGVMHTVWVTVPKIALIGAKCIWENESQFEGTAITSLLRNGLSGEQDKLRAYGWKALAQNGYLYGKKSGVFGTYYLTPSKVGVTYIDKNLVEKIYQNNLDLIMRYKYNESGSVRDHSGLQEGNYVYQSDTVNHRVNNYNLTHSGSIINNGLFSLNKSTSTITAVSCRAIDIYSSANDTLIGHLYGGYREMTPSGVWKANKLMTADELKKRYQVLRFQNDGTQIKAGRNYVIAYKVTFTSDIILNYKTATLTTWSTTYDEDGMNDIVQTTGSDNDDAPESKKYTYTTYFTVTA